MWFNWKSRCDTNILFVEIACKVKLKGTIHMENLYHEYDKLSSLL